MTVTSVQNFYDTTLAYYQGRGLHNRARRDWQYIQEPGQKGLLYSFVGVVITSSVTGMFTGISAARRIIENLRIVGTYQQNTILTVGGTGGFIVGGTMGATGHFSIVEKTENFVSWTESKEKALLRNILRERFEDDPILSSFTCPLSLTPILSAVRSPAGHLYDHKFLIACANPANGMIKDPFRVPNAQGNSFFSKLEIYEDCEASLVIEKRLKFLLARDMQELDPDSYLYKTLAFHSKELKKIIRSEYRKALDQIRLRRENAETSSISEEEEYKIRDQFEVEMTVFCHHFGKVAGENLDWDKTDWSDLLNKRWKLFPH